MAKKTLRDLNVYEWLAGATVPTKRIDMGIEFKDQIYSLVDKKEEINIHDKNIITDGNDFPTTPEVGQIMRKNGVTYIYRGEE